MYRVWLWCWAAAAVSVGVQGDIYDNRDCRDWGAPQNSDVYPLWPYCNRRPGDGNTRYSFLVNAMPPADIAPHVCSKGVLRHDADGLVCANYVQGDDYAGPCTDATCCVGERCTTFACPSGWQKRGNADQVSCYWECNVDMCCEAEKAVPRRNAAGLIFVDRDPGRFTFGGEIIVLRAPDESDITHYNVYWGFGKMVRKVPSCGLKNPVSWETTKFKDEMRLLTRLEKTGCDLRFTVPMGTRPPERCTISWDRQERTTSGTDPCNPHYLIVAAANDVGDYPVMKSNEQQVGARHPLSDYEDEFELPCAEGGVTMGHDIPGPDDIILGEWGKVPTAKMCAELCRNYAGSEPCRYWTWTYPTGGRSAKSCWIEAQTLQKTHYGVRVVGPAVCPTPDGAAPTGRERPRCTRWIREANVALFDGASFASREAWRNQGALFVQEPHLPDTPLGPFSNAEECQAICDMDVLCIGFVFMKRDPSDAYFHKCMLIHVDNGKRIAHGHYDTWTCSREGMAPLINGYQLLREPFGYKAITSKVLVAGEAALDHDCCAVRCDGEPQCAGFTFTHTTRECTLYGGPVKSKAVQRVEGCAYESCFEGYGQASYERERPRMYVIDRWPETGGGGGVPVRVQTNGHMEGLKVVCALYRGTPPSGAAGTAEDMLAESDSRRGVADVEDGVASFTFQQTRTLEPVAHGTTYTVRCGVEGAAGRGLPNHVSLTFDTELLPGYNKVGDGYCRSKEGMNKCAKGYVADTSKKPYTLDECKAVCDADSDCEAFWRRSTDGHCTIALKQCTWTRVNADGNVQCWRKYSGANVHSIGNDQCTAACDGTCNFARQLGVYDRDVFIHNRVCRANECDTDPCGMDQTCFDPSSQDQDFVCTCNDDTSIQKVGGDAVCRKDECDTSPCGGGQSCNDPNPSPQTIKDYVCTCDDDAATKATGSPATCSLNECDANPCGADHSCNDPDLKYSAHLDYICTCDMDGTIFKVGGQPTCIKDECDPSPCGADQSCNDPSPSPHHIKDFVCTCNSDPVTKAIGSAATCVFDECTAAPCSDEQSCSDPDTKYSAHLDYICACNVDSTIIKIGGQPTCVKNECDAAPCGPDQSCNDPSPSPHHIKDFVCTCDSDPSTKAVGATATCAVDECLLTPCGTDQTCSDPDTRYSSQFDFVCTCMSDSSIVKIGAQATCTKNECEAAPCGTGQACSDPNMSPHYIKDFVCTCDNDGQVRATGARATCEVDECDSTSCGAGQTCADPNTKTRSRYDFTCTCDNDMATARMGGSAVCVIDECDANPCSTQTCTDPSTAASSTGDYVCQCPSAGPSQVGGVAVCTTGGTDECTTSPCGSGQTCTDPDTQTAGNYVCKCNTGVGTAIGTPATCLVDECLSGPCPGGQLCTDSSQGMGSLSDYVCSCSSGAGMATGGPAICVVDECATTPCDVGQTCNDPDTSVDSMFDYTCTCTNGVQATGGTATCALDECLAVPPPCGAGQTCNDPNTSYIQQHDYICTCDNDTKLVQVDGPATCDFDECTRAMCDAGQVCLDLNTSVHSLKDFTCSCMNGVVATGGPATCSYDECTTSPCGPGQLCTDPNTTYVEQHDFICTCADDPAVKQVDGPAACVYNECDRQPCGLTQVCRDPNTTVHVLKDFVCTCDNGVEATGGAARCDYDECLVLPCGANQTCLDPNHSYVEQHDYVCTCDEDSSLWQVDGPAQCERDECSTNPCGEQSCMDANTSVHSLKDFTCTCDNGVSATGGRATCDVDECAGDPCGEGQVCLDVDTRYTSQHDYKCFCEQDRSVEQVDGRAICEVDECAQDPCGDQECVDKDVRVSSRGDFVCQCESGAKAVGRKADCTAVNVDECAVKPCRESEVCRDDDRTTANSYLCTPVGGGVDECLALPCGEDQQCTDKNWTALNDYICSCDDAEATGRPADCSSSDNTLLIVLVSLGGGVVCAAALAAVFYLRRPKRKSVNMSEFPFELLSDPLSDPMSNPSSPVIPSPAADEVHFSL